MESLDDFIDGKCGPLPQSSYLFELTFLIFDEGGGSNKSYGSYNTGAQANMDPFGLGG